MAVLGRGDQVVSRFGSFLRRLLSFFMITGQFKIIKCQHTQKKQLQNVKISSWPGPTSGLKKPSLEQNKSCGGRVLVRPCSFFCNKSFFSFSLEMPKEAEHLWRDPAENPTQEYSKKKK